MQKIIVDYKKLTPEILGLLNEKYPDGYGDEDIITFKNVSGEIIETVELRTNDTVYLVKISKCLANFISNFDENLEKGLDANVTALNEEDSPAAELELQSEEEFDEES